MNFDFKELKEPPLDYFPFVRWWWFGNDIEKDEISSELEGMRKNGIGGVELQSLYAATKGSPLMNDRIINWLSEEWLELVAHTTSVTKKNGLTLDLTFGNGWPFGGPHITPEYASSKLGKKIKIILGGKVCKIPIDRYLKPYYKISAILAIKIGNSTKIKDNHTNVINLTNEVDNSAEKSLIKFKLPSGLWKVIIFYNTQTKQKVKRAAPAGEGWVLDHLDKDAFMIHADRLGGKLLKKFGNDLGKYFGAFFCDSWEVYGENWTRNFLNKFKESMGYDLSDYIYDLNLGIFKKKLIKGENNREINYDYKFFHGKLILDEFFSEFARYCHKVNVECRVQPYMAPTDLLKAYSYFDILEVEGFGSHGIGTMYYGKFDPRIASSASHIYSKPMVSCESFTWLGEHFEVSLERIKQEADQIILHGVNRIIYHGYPYSPPEAGNPGLVFYASIMTNHNNTWWPYMKELNQYIARNSYIMRNTKNIADYSIYLPIHDEWSGNKNILKNLRTELKTNGHFTDFDYVNDDALVNLADFVDNQLIIGEGRYNSLILWNTEFLPLKTVKSIENLVKKGMNLIIVGETPKNAPGLIPKKENQVKEFEEIFSNIIKYKKNVFKLNKLEELHDLSKNNKWIPDFSIVPSMKDNEVIGNDKIRYIHQKIKNIDYYFIVNGSNSSSFSSKIQIRSSGTALLYDSMNDRYYKCSLDRLDIGYSKLTISLMPLESKWLIIGPESDLEQLNKNITKIDTHNVNDLQEITNILGEWTIDFYSKENNFPKENSNIFSIKTENLFDWSKKDETRYFSGTATYNIEFDIDSKILSENKEIYLDLGKVYDIADVKLNDIHLGNLWWGNKIVSTMGNLKKGHNKMEIKVTNLLLNKIIGYGIKKINYKPEYYFVNKDYKKFSPEKMNLLPSGLIGPLKFVYFAEKK